MFLRSGYLGTSVDEIAALATVSKQTVSKLVADKQRLFSEIVTSTLSQASTPSTTKCWSCRTAATSRPTCAIWRADS